MMVGLVHFTTDVNKRSFIETQNYRQNTIKAQNILFAVNSIGLTMLSV